MCHYRGCSVTDSGQALDSMADSSPETEQSWHEVGTLGTVLTISTLLDFNEMLTYPCVTAHSNGANSGDKYRASGQTFHLMHTAVSSLITEHQVVIDTQLQTAMLKWSEEYLYYTSVKLNTI